MVSIMTQLLSSDDSCPYISRCCPTHVFLPPAQSRQEDLPLTLPASVPAFQTAVALAEYRFSQKKDKEENERVTLEEQDFEQVCEMSASFKEYMTSVGGRDEAGRAKVYGDRDDDFDETGVKEV